MSIYDKKTAFDFVSVTKQVIPFALAIIVLIGVFLLFALFSEMLKPQAIAAAFSENPLELAKGSSFSKLTVTITNVLNKNAPNVSVEVKPENAEAIIVSPGKTDLGLIEKGNKRITEFIIRPNPGKTVLAGTYTLNIFVVMDGERFVQQIVLEIKAA